MRTRCCGGQFGGVIVDVDGDLFGQLRLSIFIEVEAVSGEVFSVKQRGRQEIYFMKITSGLQELIDYCYFFRAIDVVPWKYGLDE